MKKVKMYKVKVDGKYFLVEGEDLSDAVDNLREEVNAQMKNITESCFFMEAYICAS